MSVGHRFQFLFTAIFTAGSVVSTKAEVVTIEYEAEASTVVGQPFGLNVPRLTRVQGFFRYQSSTPDRSPNDLRRGSFYLGGNSWEFEARFLGHTLRGSHQATASTETFGHTLRFNDGGNRDDTGDMSFDGIARSDLALGFSIVGNATHLPTDQLPAPFLYQRGNPHTFVISDESGRMLLQFRSVNQVATLIPTPEIINIEAPPSQARLTWRSVAGQSYQVEVSGELMEWTAVGLPVTATEEETSVTAERPVTRASFYRIRRLDSP